MGTASKERHHHNQTVAVHEDDMDEASCNTGTSTLVRSNLSRNLANMFKRRRGVLRLFWMGQVDVANSILKRMSFEDQTWVWERVESSLIDHHPHYRHHKARLSSKASSCTSPLMSSHVSITTKDGSMPHGNSCPAPTNYPPSPSSPCSTTSSASSSSSSRFCFKKKWNSTSTTVTLWDKRFYPVAQTLPNDPEKVLVVVVPTAAAATATSSSLPSETTTTPQSSQNVLCSQNVM